MSTYKNPFRLNIGFLIGQSVGSSRDFVFELPQVQLDEDLNLIDLSGAAHISRTAQGLLLQASLRASITTNCVRCLSDFSQPLAPEFTELYAFNRNSITDSGLILPDDGHIDLAPLVREYMLLDIPISPLCKPDCKGLCPVCGENQNLTTCRHETTDADPRLSVLKSLIDNE